MRVVTSYSKEGFQLPAFGVPFAAVFLILFLGGCGGDVGPPEPGLHAGAPNGWRLIEGGWLLDVEAGARVPNPGVLVGPDGRIASVGTSADAPDGATAGEVLRLGSGETLLPGLIDLHAHYNMNLTGDGRFEETRYNPLVYLANGVTTTFPAGEYVPEAMRGLAERLAAGEQAGPRLLRSGAYFGSARPGWDPDTTREQVHAEVDAAWMEGVRHFKAKGATTEIISWLVERVHHHGGTVTAHVDSGRAGTANSVDAIEAGIDRIEHILGGHALDREAAAYPVWNRVDTASAEFRQTVALFLERGVYLNPTITAPVYLTELEEGFDDWADEGSYFTPWVQARVEGRERRRSEVMSELYQSMKRTTLAFYNAGGGPLLTLGTDLPSAGDFLPGFGAHRELHALVLAGLPPAAAIRAGTINGARAVGLEAELGTIAAGKWADLFVVEGDPLADIRNTRNVRWVLRAGEIHRPEALLEQARGQIGPSGPDDVEGWWRVEP
jgi:imidazolonepropionase-like amidohydrolase